MIKESASGLGYIFDSSSSILCLVPPAPFLLREAASAKLLWIVLGLASNPGDTYGIDITAAFDEIELQSTPECFEIASHLECLSEAAASSSGVCCTRLEFGRRSHRDLAQNL